MTWIRMSERIDILQYALYSIDCFTGERRDYQGVYEKTQHPFQSSWFQGVPAYLQEQ